MKSIHHAHNLIHKNRRKGNLTVAEIVAEAVDLGRKLENQRVKRILGRFIKENS